MRRTMIALLGLASCTAQVDPPAQPAAPTLPPLDAHSASELSQALDNVAPEYRPMIAARGLAELERGRLGKPLLDALDALVSASLDQRSFLVFAGLDSQDAHAGWQQRCGAPLTPAMQAISSIAEPDRLRFLTDTCPAGVADLRPAGAPEVPSEALLLALVTQGALLRAGPLDPAEQKALVLLASSPPAPPANNPPLADPPPS